MEKNVLNEVGKTMDIVFLGGVFEETELPTVMQKSRGPIQIAANSLQWNYIKGLDEANGRPVSIINAPFVGSYPKLYDDLFISSKYFSHTQGARDLTVGFINLFLIKHIIKAVALSAQLLKWAFTTTGDKKALIIYSLHSPFLFAGTVAKVFNKKIHVNIIVPDLPEFMSDKKKDGIVRRLFKFVDERLIYVLIRKADSFSLITEQMANRLLVRNRPFVVIEGMVNIEQQIYNKEKLSSDKKIILYTGTLDKRYGIDELLDAFELIRNKDYRLYICGDGDSRSEVIKRAIKDSRIKWFGFISHKEVLDLQKSATILINPRNDKGEYTKYSFPSKIMEYLLSGTPALIHKLPGIPEEYYQFLFTFDSCDPKAVADKICEVINLGDRYLEERGQQGRKFVLERKNNVIQSRMLFNLIFDK